MFIKNSIVFFICCLTRLCLSADFESRLEQEAFLQKRTPAPPESILRASDQIRHVDALIRQYAYASFSHDASLDRNLEQIAKQSRAVLPVLYKLFEIMHDDSIYIEWVINLFLRIDGYNPQSVGDETALRLVRDYLENPPNDGARRGVSPESLGYLACKGNASDLKFFQDDCPRHALEWRALLLTRNAGTNVISSKWSNLIVDYHRGGKEMFFPSVVNTGPQAVLAYEHIKAELEKVGGDISKLPPEVLTYVAPRPKSISPCSWIIYLTPVPVLLVLRAGLVYWRTRRKR